MLESITAKKKAIEMNEMKALCRELLPRQKLFLSYFTSPTSPTFGNENESFKRAGYEGSNKIETKPKLQELVKRKLNYMSEEITEETIQELFKKYMDSDTEYIGMNSRKIVLENLFKLAEMRIKLGYGKNISFDKMSNEELLEILKENRTKIDDMIKDLKKDTILKEPLLTQNTKPEPTIEELW